MKVLVLSCSTGGGHNACAKYIMEELKDNHIDCIFKDFYDIVNPKVKELSSKLYLSTLKNNGNLFKGVYKIGETVSSFNMKSPVYLINKTHQKALLNFIKYEKIDLVISSHLFPSLTLTAINQKNKEIPFITVATDYEPCPFIEETKSDYLIIQKGLENRFIEKNIPANTLISTGIPISTNFITSAKNIKKALNINENEKVILILLGSMGFGNINKLLEKLKNKKYHIIVVCGTNEKLKAEIKKMNYSNITVLGFVSNINDLIYSSDIVLSKPGGLSTTEIATLRKPLIHIYPIPGIETHNTNFFKAHNMSIVCQDDDEIISTINKLLNNEDLRNEIISNQKKYINGNSAKDLINLIKSKFQK